MISALSPEAISFLLLILTSTSSAIISRYLPFIVQIFSPTTLSTWCTFDQLGAATAIPDPVFNTHSLLTCGGRCKGQYVSMKLSAGRLDMPVLMFVCALMVGNVCKEGENWIKTTCIYSTIIRIMNKIHLEALESLFTYTHTQ